MNSYQHFVTYSGLLEQLLRHGKPVTATFNLCNTVVNIIRCTKRTLLSEGRGPTVWYSMGVLKSGDDLAEHHWKTCEWKNHSRDMSPSLIFKSSKWNLLTLGCLSQQTLGACIQSGVYNSFVSYMDNEHCIQVNWTESTSYRMRCQRCVHN